MLNTTLHRLRCPAQAQKSPGRSSGKNSGKGLCGSRLRLKAERADSQPETRGSQNVYDVLSGELICDTCQASYPILGGVAILVPDVRGFLLEHVKGLKRVVPEAEWPREFARELKAASAQIRSDHIEDDLEAERVISLYLLNHFAVAKASEVGVRWWRPLIGSASPLLEKLILEYWGDGPLDQIGAWMRERATPVDVLELGCGVGGLAIRIGECARSYLGVDSSFSAIALARHLLLGGPSPGKIRVPEDLLSGPISRELSLGQGSDGFGGSGQRDSAGERGAVDFVVGEIQHAPVQSASWDVVVALNAIDMLEDPAQLPVLKKALLRKGGVAIQSSPYIWHEIVAKRLRSRLPALARGSSSLAAEWLYERAGFETFSREEHVPWLFFKHVRQLEIYSVHWFAARLKG